MIRAAGFRKAMPILLVLMVPVSVALVLGLPGRQAGFSLLASLVVLIGYLTWRYPDVGEFGLHLPWIEVDERVRIRSNACCGPVLALAGAVGVGGALFGGEKADLWVILPLAAAVLYSVVLSLGIWVCFLVKRS